MVIKRGIPEKTPRMCFKRSASRFRINFAGGVRETRPHCSVASLITRFVIISAPFAEKKKRARALKMALEIPMFFFPHPIATPV